MRLDWRNMVLRAENGRIAWNCCEKAWTREQALPKVEMDSFISCCDEEHHPKVFVIITSWKEDVEWMSLFFCVCVCQQREPNTQWVWTLRAHWCNSSQVSCCPIVLLSSSPLPHSPSLTRCNHAVFVISLHILLPQQLLPYAESSQGVEQTTTPFYFYVFPPSLNIPPQCLKNVGAWSGIHASFHRRWMLIRVN